MGWSLNVKSPLPTNGIAWAKVTAARLHKKTIITALSAALLLCCFLLWSSLANMHISAILPLALSTVSYAQQYTVKTPPLTTNWTYTVGTNPWPEYPRPKLQRTQWQSLNGIWTYANASSLEAVKAPPFNKTLPQEVLVPFCLESGLSGLQAEYLLYSWYQTKFKVPSAWTGGRTLLNFGAVDYEATVFVNGKNATFNRGGYFGFSVDITDFLKSGDNEL